MFLFLRDSVSFRGPQAAVQYEQPQGPLLWGPCPDTFTQYQALELGLFVGYTWARPLGSVTETPDVI